LFNRDEAEVRMRNLLNLSPILISGEELKARLGESRLKILHVQMSPVVSAIPSGSPSTEAVPSFESSPQFIPGAQVFDLESMSDESSPLPHMALPVEDFARKVRALGINSDDEIIVYDEQGVYSAPRARALFLNAGHERVRILNGGLPEWKRQGAPLFREPSSKPGEGDFIPRGSRFKFVDQASVLRSIESQGSLILDARSEARFKGLVEEPRAGLSRGHIPSACSMPFSEVLDGSSLKSSEELKRIFLGQLTANQEVIVYCGSGVTACIVALALEVAGYPEVSVYDGSWSEWGQSEPSKAPCSG